MLVCTLLPGKRFVRRGGQLEPTLPNRASLFDCSPVLAWDLVARKFVEQAVEGAFTVRASSGALDIEARFHRSGHDYAVAFGADAVTGVRIDNGGDEQLGTASYGQRAFGVEIARLLGKTGIRFADDEVRTLMDAPPDREPNVFTAREFLDRCLRTRVGRRFRYEESTAAEFGEGCLVTVFLGGPEEGDDCAVSFRRDRIEYGLVGHPILVDDDPTSHGKLQAFLHERGFRVDLSEL